MQATVGGSEAGEEGPKRREERLQWALDMYPPS